MRFARHLSLVSVAVLAACADAPQPSPTPSAAPPVAAPAQKTWQEVPVTSTSMEAVEAFNRGRDLALNTRYSEAMKEMEAALKLDPKFAFAMAWLGSMTPGADGIAKLDEASKLAASLPPPERDSIDELRARTAGDRGKARELARKVVDQAPFDWRAQLELGNRLFDEHKLDDAAQAFAKAAAFGPKPPVAYNELGYTYLAQHKVDAAVSAFRKYAHLSPDEPNALDSLGEALMNAGRFAESEKAFLKAAAMNFSFAYDGAALTRFFRNDWVAGFDLNAKAKDAAVLPSDRLDSEALGVWASLAQHDLDGAQKRIDALEKDAQASKLDEQIAMASVYRAVLLDENGKTSDALRELDKAGAQASKSKLPGNAMARVRRATQAWRAVFQAKIGDKDADKSAAEVEDDAKKAPTDAELQSLASLAKGAASIAKGDAKTASDQLAACLDEDYLCRWVRLGAEEKLGESTDTDLVREHLVEQNLRDGQYLYVRAKVAAPTQTAASKSK